MLAGRLQKTGPFGWNGSSSTVQEHLHQTFQRLRGSGLQEHELAALDSFLHAMHTPRLRAPAPGSDMAKVARGKEIFESADSACATCHRTDDAFIDRTKHDVGSKAKADNETSFDTPTLRFVGATAPYFHDGRYATLREMLLGHDGKMGRTNHLKPADLEALEAYLQTLLPPPAQRPARELGMKPPGPLLPEIEPPGEADMTTGDDARVHRGPGAVQRGQHRATWDHRVLGPDHHQGLGPEPMQMGPGAHLLVVILGALEPEARRDDPLVPGLDAADPARLGDRQGDRVPRGDALVDIAETCQHVAKERAPLPAIEGHRAGGQVEGRAHGDHPGKRRFRAVRGVAKRQVSTQGEPPEHEGAALA
jgi:mono/diheme cytochrome c family protein